MKQQEAMRHHYLPQFHLKAWCNAKGQLFAYRRDESGALVEFIAHRRKVAVESGLYTAIDPVGLDSGRPHDSYETEFLSPIDAAAADAHTELLAGGPDTLTAKQRKAWCVYMSSLLERTPRVLDPRDATALEIAERLKREVLERSTDRELIERLASSVREERLKMSSRNVVRGLMVQQVKDPRFLAHLNGLSWIVQHLEGVSLPICDTPLFVNGTFEPEYPLHFFWLALSPNVLMLGIPGSWQIDDETAGVMWLAYSIATLLAPSRQLFSKVPLADGPILRARTAAEGHFGRPKVRAEHTE
jgi:Protein of unknown function (DUF4238)